MGSIQRKDEKAFYGWLIVGGLFLAFLAIAIVRSETVPNTPDMDTLQNYKQAVGCTAGALGMFMFFYGAMKFSRS